MTGPRRIGVEFKYTSNATVTKSMHIVMQDLNLDRIYVVHPGQGKFPLTERITAAGLSEMYGIVGDLFIR